MSLGLNKRKLVVDKKGNARFFNDSNKANSSHKVDQPTNFNLQTITLEDIDQGVFQEFNGRFKIGDKTMKLYSGDAETTSLANLYPEDFDSSKGFLTWPFFIYSRTSTNKIWRTNPAYKQVLYATPKKKAQGIVIEEYISTGPINYELIYEFKFVTYFREHCNNMEEQMNHYFRNTRNIFKVSNESFTIGPETKNNLCNIEMMEKDEASQTTMYVLTFKLKVWAWTRDLSDMQKRERPNSFTLDFVVKDDNNNICNSSKDVINLEQFVVTNKTAPDERIDPT